MLTSVKENSPFMQPEPNCSHIMEGDLDSKLLEETLNEESRGGCTELVSLNIDNHSEQPNLEPSNTGRHKSVLLIDNRENLVQTKPERFLKIFGGQKYKQSPVNVISIFGKIGDGKSHTLNKSVFDDDVFVTSSEQGACTKGVYAAYSQEMNALCLDTEGMSGSSGHENIKIRTLWKVFAISDIAIFRTRSEKLQDDMFQFLGNASKAYQDHFSETIYGRKFESTPDFPGTTSNSRNNSRDNSPSTIPHGPLVIIFHETMNTKVLKTGVDENAEDKIRKIFSEKNLDISTFYGLKYHGIQAKSPPKNYDSLKKLLSDQLDYKYRRAPGSQNTPKDIYDRLEILNKKFNKPIDTNLPLFSLKILECGELCQICSEPCQRSMNHEGEKHRNYKRNCFYNPTYENKIRLCRVCYNERNEEITLTETVNRGSTGNSTSSSWLSSISMNFSDSSINCINCGEIYRNGWFVSKPVENVVHTKIVHVWPGGDILPKGPSYSGQKVVDGISSLTSTVHSYTAEPTKIVSNWLINKVNPSYWRNDNEIYTCFNCAKHFESLGLPKHHCRKCGEGFCDACTQKRRAVPEYGFTTPSRVCDKCDSELSGTDGSATSSSSTAVNNSMQSNESDTIIRRYSEAVFSTLKPAGWVYEQSLNYIKYKTRPDYWTPDENSPNCSLCKFHFDPTDSLGNHNNTQSSKDLTAGSGSGGAINSGAGGDSYSSKNNSNIKDNRRHHCRACGEAVCNKCSQGRVPVPEKGWEYDVRVCEKCYNERKSKRE